MVLCWNFGISTSRLLSLHCGDKMLKIRTFFKKLVSNKERIWRLKEYQSNDKLFIKDNFFREPHGIKNIHRSKLHL